MFSLRDRDAMALANHGARPQIRGPARQNSIAVSRRGPPAVRFKLKIIPLTGLRDCVLIGLMVHSFARVGAAVTMTVGDLFQHRKQVWLRLHEKGGKRHEVPCHPELELYLTAWTPAAGLGEKKSPVFRRVFKGERLGEKVMSRFDVLHMIKRRAQAAALPYSTCCHTFRETGITWKMAAILSTRNPLPLTRSPRTTNSTIAHGRNCPSKRSARIRI